VLGRDLEQRAGVDLGDLLDGSFCRSPLSWLKSSSPSASSTSRRWSSASSALRVTFSVAMIVRSATSARISWIARRVSASMSRRVCSRSSSRLTLACSSDSRSWTSPALRARATISSAWARASRSRWRYSSSSSEASARARSAVSIDSSIALCRLSSAWVIAGHAYLRSTSIAITNASSVQIISPTVGLTRKLELSSSADCACARTNMPSDVIV
jgi:hypothetical protein